jgi:hypothetical protein
VVCGRGFIAYSRNQHVVLLTGAAMGLGPPARYLTREGWGRFVQVDLAARLVARHLELGHSLQALIATLAHAVLREDASFHTYQMLEAGVRQFAVWENTDEGRNILIAVARYLAAHSPADLTMDGPRGASSGRGEQISDGWG